MDEKLQILWDDGERMFSRERRLGEAGIHRVLLARPAADQPPPASLDRLAHEFSLKDELDAAWAVRPLEMGREGGRTTLVLEDPGGELLAQLLGVPMEIPLFLRLASGIAAALGQLHQRGLVHKDLKPTHILVNCSDGHARLTGFGLASRLRRERQPPQPPETIAGTLAYMAPEQTGRMNRSIDSRSDLYAFGVTLYQMVTGALPFSAVEPMEWVHCHIARKPVPPSARIESIPAAVSGIIMKLLAKTAEDRYQTAAGVEHDLLQCLADWQLWHRVEGFPLGKHDTPHRLLIPEKLYGRERDVDTLVTAFDRMVGSGTPELVLVSGYSGIGKSSVINELHKVLVPPRGLFASGKFDQYKRDIPYSTLVEAFQSLVRPLLGKRETELRCWRDALLEALDVNARLMTDLIPELKLIIGEPPPVPELEPQQAQRRFMLVFRLFIGVFAREEHPLALFLDDLQWLDVATLDLLEDLLTRSDLQYLILVGAYRDNEVDATHPLTAKLQAIRSASVRINEITLAPLARTHVTQLIADALHCEPQRSAPLAQLVHDKTAGNPFFVIQFLHALVEEDLLIFDHESGRWRWDPDRIHAKGYTDNVVDLMVAKLSRLPADTQRVLQQLACLGNIATITTLSAVLGMTELQVHAVLWVAIRQELVERRRGAYRFAHDRIHEAVYSLIPQASRTETHLRIGRLLADETPPEQREEAIFEIVSQLNRGAPLITSREEREELAGFNLLASRRAKASTAYASALTYLVTGVELLDDDGWERRHELIFALELNRAECEFLTGQLLLADHRLASLSKRSTTTVEQASVACLHTDICTTLDQNDRAVAVCLDYLRHVGIDWSPHPDDEVVRREYDHISVKLADRAVEELINLPLMEDPAALSTAEVLGKLAAPAVQTDENLVSLMSCKAVNLSLEHGNCDASCFAYVLFSRVAGPCFDDYQLGYRFGQLGYDLVQQRGLKRFEAKTSLCYATFVARWMKPVRTCRDLLRRAFVAAHRIGDIPYSAFACNVLNSDLLFAGEPLPEVHVEAERGLVYVEKVRFGLVIDFIATQLALIRTLRGLTPTFGCFDDGQFSEHRIERHLSSNPALANPMCWYWIRKLQARYLAGDFAAAMDAAAKAQPLLWTSTSFIEEAEYHFYRALTEAARYDSAPADERSQHLEAVTAHHRQIQIWAANCPANFADRVALVGAEIARIEGRVVDAEDQYEQAIRAAQESGFVQNEALANELASRFFTARGLEKIARVYLQDARYGYLRWRADGKVRQLEKQYPFLRTEEPTPHPTATIATPVEHLDLATVIRISQAASGDIVLEKLIDMIMRMAIEQAGAERGLLILSDGGEQRIAAEATTGGEATRLQLRDVPVAAEMLPESILYHVLRTRESVILDDAAAAPAFAADSYIREHRARSILCLPLMNQAKLTGALYLENNLTARVFSPNRIAVLKLVASQAAISLENAALYTDLQRSEAFLSQGQKMSHTGTFGWSVDSEEHYWSEEGYNILEYDRGVRPSMELALQRIHPDDRNAVRQALDEAVKEKRDFDSEHRFVMPDGRVKHVHVTGRAVSIGNLEFVGAIRDITERTRAEEALRQAQTDLAHINRVTTMGELTASLAHEINQPIAGAIAYASACLRWLDRDKPDLDEARAAATGMVNNGLRAAQIIGRIRTQFEKGALDREVFCISEIIRETVGLLLGEAARYGISVRTQLGTDLPQIVGDRVQLQQVVMNLIVNAIEAMKDVDGTREMVIGSQTGEEEQILVSVSDTGIGISPQFAERIFDPFFTTKPHGTGMGLRISRSIVESHGGCLWVVAALGRGAIFRFTLPATLRTVVNY
jgi:predicted ATPase/signal transduction histidine kinase